LTPQTPPTPPTAGIGRSTNGTVLEATKTKTDTGFTGRCMLLRFDTSSLPDTATVMAATLRCYVTASVTTNARSFSLGWYAWDGSSSTDYTMTAETDAHAGTALGSIATNADNDFALVNLANISKTGISYLRGHITGGEPLGTPWQENYIVLAAWDHATLTEPRLIVDYDLVPGAPAAPTGLTATVVTTGD
jgi:hypothetical protein